MRKCLAFVRAVFNCSAGGLLRENSEAMMQQENFKGNAEANGLCSFNEKQNQKFRKEDISADSSPWATKMFMTYIYIYA